MLLRPAALVLLLLALPDVLSGARVKRRLVFADGSKFNLRFNVKQEMLSYTTIFAIAAGFAVAYPLPKDAKENFLRRIFRRDVYSDVEHLISHNGINGRACVLRAVCEAANLKKPKGLIQKIVHRIFSVPDEERHVMSPYHVPEGDCGFLEEQCPVSLVHMALLTDDEEFT